MSEHSRPSVGVAVLIRRDGKVLFCRRHGSHGADTWSIPGGHLELGESFEECARREVLEEIGCKIKNLKFMAVTNDIFTGIDAGKHYISIWMQADWDSVEPKIMEPHKITDIDWRKLSDLPSPLFEPCWANLRKDHPELFA